MGITKIKRIILLFIVAIVIFSACANGLQNSVENLPTRYIKAEQLYVTAPDRIRTVVKFTIDSDGTECLIYGAEMECNFPLLNAR